MSKIYVDEIRPKTSGNQVLFPTKPAFRAYSSAGENWQSFGGTGLTLFAFDTTGFNVGNHYNTSSYKFVAPVAGLYNFYLQWYGNGSSNDCFIKINGTTIATSRYKTADATSALTVLCELDSGDEVTALGRIDTSDSTDWYGGDTYSYFEGYLIG